MKCTAIFSLQAYTSLLSKDLDLALSLNEIIVWRFIFTSALSEGCEVFVFLDSH